MDTVPLNTRQCEGTKTRNNAISRFSSVTSFPVFSHQLIPQYKKDQLIHCC